MSALRHWTQRGLERIEGAFDAVFSPAWNPLYQLGALAFFFYWIVAASGIYVYIFFDTSALTAYSSVEYMTNEQWYAAGVMRSLHRYASDALAVVMLLHLVREFILDRFRGIRWFAWITGVPILWLVFTSGITGYWLVWDKLAQYVAVMTTEWLDTIPIFSESIAGNFLNQAHLNDRFFTLMVFIHIVVPLFLLFIMWIHLQRVVRARINPPAGLAGGLLGMLLVLSLVYPAQSQGGMANLDQVVSTIGLDWFYLLAYPLLDDIPGLWLWAGLVGGSTILFFLPWLPPRKKPPAAQVNLAHCNGCTRCFADCPFGAIIMNPRSDGLPFLEEAVVDPDLCTACGICVGSCPSSTPFRRIEEFVSGIELPQFPLQSLRDKITHGSTSLQGAARVIVIGCESGPDISSLREANVAAITLPCVGMLPPPFIDFILSRNYADGVFLTGCREGNCHQRLGLRWTQERIAQERDPYLRKRVPRSRLSAFWAGRTRRKQLIGEITSFRAKLKTMPPYGESAPGESGSANGAAP